MTYGKVALIGAVASIGGMWLLNFVPRGLVSEENPSALESLAVMSGTAACAAMLAYSVLK